MDWTRELVFLLALVNSVLSLLPAMTHVHTKFEYKYSFKGPYLTDSKGRIPFWTFGGSKSIDTKIRLHKLYHLNVAVVNDVQVQFRVKSL